MDMFNSRVLVADPDVNIRESLQLYFELNKHQVKTVAEGGDILRVARSWQPHAILVSTKFADIDSYQLCRDLFDDTLTGHIPVVMLLDINERKARLEALEAGVSDIVAKPFDIEELLLRVEAAIRLSTMRMTA